MNIVGTIIECHLDTINVRDNFHISIYAEFVVGEDEVKYYTQTKPRRPLFGQAEIKYHNTAIDAQSYVNTLAA